MFADVDGSGFDQDVPEPDGVEWDRSVKLAQEKRVGALALSSGVLGAHVFSWINYVFDLMSGTMGF